ncbi:hypothetical protein N5079_32655 [Planotetraspora sp. A-T 1434]|uniref:hypothetical protein n=1 Tax=Planotetraspora sp. A-T 1434 TaxID=2979219 RepID=UPI0021C06890|nr:hypothetical protein [Planotetraspora sp. A-T 1434]MCT9934967.1 hypothetical protein [Planotetraspora sp. A-T 1434]
MAVDLIKAIAELLGAIAWPITVVVVSLVVLGRHREALNRLIDRIRSVAALGGQVDLDALQDRQEQELESKIDHMADVKDDREALRAAAEEVAEAARLLGQLEALRLRKDLYKNSDDDPRGPWLKSDLFSLVERPELRYEVTSPSGKMFIPPEGRSWRIREERFRELDEDGRIYWGRNGDSRPTLKRFAPTS